MLNGSTSSKSFPGATRNQRRAYQPPRLSLLGDICSLTETGSMAGMEDSVENNMCVSFPPFFNVNMTFNMC